MDISTGTRPPSIRSGSDYWKTKLADDDNILRPAFRAIENSEADRSARLTADALISAHVNSLGKVYDQRKFAEAIAAAIIAARTAGHLEQDA